MHPPPKWFVALYVAFVAHYSLFTSVDWSGSEPFVERSIQAICDAARTGDVGDGKIFGLPLDHTVRIRTGERGNDALTAVNADEIMRKTPLEMPIPKLEDF